MKSLEAPVAALNKVPDDSGLCSSLVCLTYEIYADAAYQKNDKNPHVMREMIEHACFRAQQKHNCQIEFETRFTK